MKQSTCTIIVVTACLAAIAFLAGMDHEMDKQEEASKADRLRIYCQSEGHIETLCARAVTELPPHGEITINLGEAHHE